MQENCFFVICPLKGLRTKMSDFCKNIMFSLESCFYLIMKKSINYTVFFYFILLSNGLVIGCNRDMLDCKHSLPRSKVALPSSIVYVWVFEFIHVHLSFCLMIFFCYSCEWIICEHCGIATHGGQNGSVGYTMQLQS